MNTQTLILTVLIFWLIMGNNESVFFMISIVVGLVVVAFKLA